MMIRKLSYVYNHSVLEGKHFNFVNREIHRQPHKLSPHWKTRDITISFQIFWLPTRGEQGGNVTPPHLTLLLPTFGPEFAPTETHPQKCEKKKVGGSFGFGTFFFQVPFHSTSSPYSAALAFCQGLAFHLCVSALMMNRSVLLRKTSCASGERLASLVFRLQRTFAPSALNTRTSRSWLISHGPC